MNWWDTVRLGLGAFLVSSGFAGLAALAAAVIAYLGIRKRIDADRELATAKAEADHRAVAAKAVADRDAAIEADQRARWWSALMWLWDNQASLNVEQALEAISKFDDASLTPQQSAMLLVVLGHFEAKLGGTPNG